MATDTFNRDELATWYAGEHQKTDPGIVAVYYLPADSPGRELRLIEVNELIGRRDDSALTPIDFGVATGLDEEHSLLVLDVTPEQWERLRNGTLSLPAGWSLSDARCLTTSR